MSKTLRTAGMVVAAVALVATGVGAVVGTDAVIAAGVTVGQVATFAAVAAGTLSFAAAATAPGVSNQGSATNFTTNPQSGLPYAMGRTRMSGLRFYANTNSRPGYTKFNDLLWFGALLSIGGQIDSIEKFTADSEVVTFASDGNAIGTYHDYQAQKVHLGGAPMASAIALSLGGGTAPGWTSDDKLSGITHAMWCLRYNKQGDMYGAGAPEPAWIGKWVRVYDPRKDSTYPGGSGSHRALDESTYEWSDNPGLHALTWSLGRWENGKRTCGIGAPVDTIRMADFVECANVCDANGWKVGGVEWTTDSKWDTLKRILQAGGAAPTQTSAMIGCRVNTPRTAIATIESRHLLDGLSIAMTKSRRDRFNSVIPRYVDEDSEWSVISGTAITEPAYVTADKGQRTKEIDFPLVQVFSGEDAKQPGQLAAYEIVDSREAGPFNWTTGPEWIGLKTGDVIYLNVPEEGLVNQPVLITRRAIDPATGKVSFSAQTETYSKHAYALGQSTTPPAPFQLSAPDLKPAAPVEASWSVSGAISGEGLPALLVVGEAELPSADAVVIDYRRFGTEEWNGSATLSAVEPVSHVIAPLESSAAYDVRIGYRVESIVGNFTIFANVTTGTGKITIIESQLGDIDADLGQLDSDIATATAAIAAAQSTISQMQADAEEVRVGFEQDIASLNAEADQIRTDAAAATAGVQAQVTSLQGTAAQIQQDAAATRSSLEASQATIAAQGQSISQAQADIVSAGGRIDTIQSTLGDQAASISTIAQTVSNHTGRLATVESTVSANSASISQNATAISTVQGDVASLSQTVSAHGASISQNATAIGTTQGNLATLSGTVSSQGASISTLQSASSTQAGNIATLQQQVTAGNPNMLHNPSFSEGLAGWNYNGPLPGTTLVQVQNPIVGYYADVTGLSSSSTGVGYIDADPVVAYAQAAFACTCNLQVVGTGPVRGWIEMLYLGSNGVEIARTTGPIVTNPTLGGTVRNALTVVGTSPTGTSKILVRIVFSGDGNQLTQVVFNQVKLEMGYVATAFSDDVSVRTQYQAISSNTAQLASLSSTVSTQGGSISTLQSSMTTAQGNISTLQSTVSSQGGSITTLQQTVSAQGGTLSTLSSTVSSQGASITTAQSAITTLQGNYSSLSSTVSAQGSTINNQASAISNLQGQTATLDQRVSAGSSPNLVKNSSFEIGTMSNWEQWGAGWNVNTQVSNAWGAYAASSTQIGDGAFAYITSDFIYVEPGYYTMSADMGYFINGGTGVMYLEINWYDVNGTFLGAVGGPPYIQGYNFDITGDKRKAMAVSGYTPSNATQARARTVWRKDSGSIQSMHVRQVKFERGQLATPYSAEAVVATTYQALNTVNTQYASLTSTVSTQGVTISSQQTAISSINGQVSTLFGRAALSLDVNGYITGWEANNNGSMGDFTVRADRFRIVTPSGGARTLEIRQGTIIGYHSNGNKMYQLGEQSVA